MANAGATTSRVTTEYGKQHAFFLWHRELPAGWSGVTASQKGS
jgi:uncharacterized protein YbdZ (MbtH family)